MLRPLTTPAHRACVRAAALLFGIWLTSSPANAQPVTTEADLRNQIIAANDAGSGTITLGGTIALTGSLPPIQSNITFVGGGFSINAASLGRVFTIVEGTVTIANLTIQNARAFGGAGGAGGFPGGGGAGIGAAIFVGNGSVLTTTNVVIQDAAAFGGTGGALIPGLGGGGGGGFGAPGGATQGLGGGGGGGFAAAGGVGGLGGGGGGGGGLLGPFGTDLFGAAGGAGSAGGGGGGGRRAAGGGCIPAVCVGGGEGGGDTAAGMSATPAAPGAGGSPEGGDGGNSFAPGQPGADNGGGGGGGIDAAGGSGARSSGGGGGGADANMPNPDPLQTAGGGSGSMAGGGGAGSNGIGAVGSEFGGGGGGGVTGGRSALFGGGGGGIVTGGDAVFGGGGAGGVTPGLGPFGGAGNGATNGAGGGSAVGGAIFVEEGGTLTMNSPSFVGPFTVTPGAATPGSAAQGGVAQGAIVFSQGGSGRLPLVVDVPAGPPLTFALPDSLAGGGRYRKTGAGRLTLSAANPNAMGQFQIAAGELALGLDAPFGGEASIEGDGGALTSSGGARVLTTPVSLLAGGLTVTGLDSITLNGPITSPVGVVGGLTASLTAPAILTLAGANTIPGTVTVTSGTLQTAGGANFGSLAGAGNTVLAGGLTVGGNNTSTLYSGIISGIGSLTKVGTGTLTLAAANGYAGGTSVLGGLLAVASAAPLGSGPLTLNGGGLQAAAPAVVLAIPVSLPGPGTIDTLANMLTISGAITGAGSLTKIGTGTLTLSGANTYTGGTSVLGGLLAVAGPGPLGTGPLNLSGGGLLAAAPATLAIPITLGGAGTIDTQTFALTVNGPIAGAGSLTKTGTGTLTLGVPASYTGATTVAAGTLAAGVANAFSAGSVHTVNLGATLSLNNTNQTLNSLAGPGTVALGTAQLTLATAGAPQTFGGAITGTGGVTVAGTGSLTLNGAQTYTGATTVLGGTLTVPGSLASTSLLVNGGTLALSGSAAATTVTLSSGALTVTGSLPSATSVQVTNGLLTASGGAAVADGATLTVTAPGTATFNGSETIGTLNGSGTVTLASGVLTAGAGTYSGPMSGAGALAKSGAGTLTLSGPNTFTGATTINAGTLSVTGGASLADAAPVTVNAGATLSVASTETLGPVTSAGNLAVGSGAILTVAGAINATGPVALASGSTLSATEGTIAGIISGAGGLTKTGAGTMTLAAVNTYTGATSLSAGTLIVQGGASIASPTTMTGGTLLVPAGGAILSTATVTGGTLTGGGSVAGANLTGGTIQPSSIFTVNGNFNLGAGATLTTVINGTDPATQFGQVRVLGTVTLAGTLSATLGAGFTPVEGNSFVIIDNDGADAVSGTFAGLAQGARVNLGGLNLSITYTGGDGNDVVLEAPVGAPLFTTYLAEGATNAFFDVRIALVNPNTTVATGTMRFLKSTGVTVNHPVTIPAMGRITINPELEVPDMADANFSTVVETNVRVVVDRTMSWDASGYGSHAETSSSAPATTWYFAEGATHGQFTLFYLLQNATSTDAQVVITYLRPAGAAPIEQPVTVGANSRMTIQVDEVQGLAETDVSAIIRVTNGVPISTERAMYVSTPEQPFAAGTDVAGIAAPSTTWFFAEGATGPFFDFFLLLANPNPTDAQVSVTYDTSMSGSVTKPYTVAANSRQTISVQQEDLLLDNEAIAATVTSTNNVPILAERAIFWPAYPWYEGHASAGVTATGTRWALADGEAGGALDTQTYILIANTGSANATVRVTLLLEAGGTLTRDFPILPNARFNVNAGVEFPNAMNQRFGALVESIGATPQPIVVERSMYTNAGGVIWAAGTNALATRLQ